MEYLFIYLLQITEIISSISEFTLFVGVFVLIVAIAGFYTLEGQKNSKYKTEQEKKTYEKIQNLCRILPAILLIIGFVSSFFPTKQTLLLMGGYYLGKKTVNAVVTDEKIKKIDTIINLELDKRIKDLKSENK